jgi:peptidoglycan hydrolase-like protein with peptidoglycan-binding domain
MSQQQKVSRKHLTKKRAAMKRATVVAAFALGCMGLSLPIASAQGAASTSSSFAATTSGKKTTSKKKRHHYSRRQPTQKAPTPDRISEIQSALARDGYYHGDPNGKWDASTVGAMQKFQSDHGLDATGKLDARSLQKLGLGSDIAGVSSPRPITPGSSTPPASQTAPTSKPAQQPSTSSGAAATSANLTPTKIPQQ